MRKLIRRLLKPINLWIALALLAANGFAWATVVASGGPPYIAEPILEPGLADLRTRLREGGHSGETFELSITGQEAAESIAWFIEKYPEIPFRNPRIVIHPGLIEAWGEIEIFGMRLSLHGYATMVLEDNAPIFTLTDLEVAGAPVPNFVLEGIQGTIYEQVDVSNRELPVIIERLDLREDEAVASGTIR